MCRLTAGKHEYFIPVVTTTTLTASSISVLLSFRVCPYRNVKKERDDGRVVTDGDKCGTESYKDKSNKDYGRTTGKNYCRIFTLLLSNPAD